MFILPISGEALKRLEFQENQTLTKLLGWEIPLHRGELSMPTALSNVRLDWGIGAVIVITAVLPPLMGATLVLALLLVRGASQLCCRERPISRFLDF